MASSDFKEVVMKDYSTTGITERFTNTLFNLNEIFSANLDKHGSPIYNVWIKMQIGEDENNSIMFDSTSQIYERNLIADLQMTKGQNGYANDFTLNIHFDAFKNGQNGDVGDTVERLDQWIADAVTFDFTEGNINALKGKLQYGYSSFDDVDRQLYTPIYSFYLTEANSSTDFNSGISHYTFGGVASIAADINFTTDIEAQKGRPLSIVKKVLTKYYGRPGDSYDGVTADDTALGYIIDISEEELNAQQNESESFDLVTEMNPWKYCESILEKCFLTQLEIDSGNFTETKLAKMQNGQKPKYVMYITELDDQKIIHVTHVSSLNLSQQELLPYEFTWSNNQNNIVTSWNPETDFKVYLIRYATAHRKQKEFDNLLKNYWSDYFQQNATADAKLNIAKKLNLLQKEIAEANEEVIKEYYNATMECVGIPTDAPIGALLKITPVILQTVSRTAGIYFITGASDSISTRGTYTTTLKLFRVNSIEGFAEYQDEIIPLVNEQVQEDRKKASESVNRNVSSGTGAGGGFSTGGGGGHGGGGSGGR